MADDVILENIAVCSEGLSGSDLREVCRYAAACRVRDYVNQENSNQSDNLTMPAIRMQDFEQGMKKLLKSKADLSLDAMNRISGQ